MSSAAAAESRAVAAESRTAAASATLSSGEDGRDGSKLRDRS